MDLQEHPVSPSDEDRITIPEIIRKLEIQTEGLPKARDFKPPGCENALYVSRDDVPCGFHLREADLYFEIIDPDSGRPLPPGEVGEVVVTTLTRRGMPLVRYRTGDLARFRAECCPCGTVLRTLERVQGRLHEVIRLRTGEWTGKADFDDAFFPISGIVDYTVAVTAESNVDRMDILIAAGPQSSIDSAAISVAALSIPAIRRAVEQARLIMGNVYAVAGNSITAEEAGFAEQDLARVHSPIGMAIGAETPEEIGTSMLDELIGDRAKRKNQ